jgi:hypothetical protein
MQRMDVAEGKRDRFARTAHVTLSRFLLNTPYFFTLVKTSDEFRLLNELTIGSPGEHFGGCIVRLFDAHKIIGERVANTRQTRLDLPSTLIEEPFQRYQKDYPIIVDPATEYLYYLSDLGKWTKDEQIHPKIREFANTLFRARKRKISRTWRKERNLTLWNYDLANNLDLEHDVISSTFDAELHYGSCALLALGPLINDISDLDTAIEINELAIADAIDKDAEFGNYFILTSDAILDKDLKKKLEDFLAKSPVNLNFLKFKFLNLRYARRRVLRAYVDFYRRLAEIREQKKEKIFCVLENDFQAFVSAVVAFDIVSTSMTGYDRYPRGKAVEGFGGLFSKRELYPIEFEEYKEAYVNNDEKPLCDHKPCQNVDPRQVTRGAWYAARRRDYVLCMNDLMSRAENYVIGGNIEQARQDVINSFMSPLKDLMPTHWEGTEPDKIQLNA